MGDSSGCYQHFEALASSSGGPAVLVLGGSTFMGRALVERLLERRARVCTVNRGRSYWGTSDASGGLAARVLADRSDVAEFSSRLDEATRRLGERWALVADFSAYNGSDMRAALEGLRGRFDRYAYISSDSVYEVSAWAGEGWLPRADSGDEPCVAEVDAERPASQESRRKLRKADKYGDGKLEAEEVLAKEFAKHAETARGVALRLPDVIGPFDDTLRLWAYWHWLRAGAEQPPQVLDERSAKRPRRCTDAEPKQASEPSGPDTVPLAFVFSQDVARFIEGLLSTAPRGGFDAVNVACREQLDLAAFLGMLASASSLDSLPRLQAVQRPRTFLPSVDRPWSLSCKRLEEVYNFTPTPLHDVLRTCSTWFEKACAQFPKEAVRSVGKLPPVARVVAAERAGLTPPSSSSTDSDGSSSES